MTFADVLDWCRKNHADVRGVYRGKDISIGYTDNELPANLPSIGEIFHWDVEIGDWNHYVSGSDFERMVTGKLTLDGFKSTLRREE
jgi:hypothetical protein